MDKLEELKSEFCEACRIIYARRLVAGAGGNLSWRISNGILLTPSGHSLRDITPDSVILVNSKGEASSGLKPTREANMHVQVLEARRDINVICHVHSPAIIAVTSFFKPGANTMPPITPSFSYYAYPLPMIPYLPPGSQALAGAVTEVLNNSEIRAVLLQYHGLVAVGDNLKEAINISEEIEEAAQVFLLSQGKAGCLTEKQVKELKNIL